MTGEGQLDAVRWRQARELFDALADIAPPERTAKLRETCGDDLELLREVESLLAFDHPSVETIEKLVVDAAQEAIRDGAPAAYPELPATVGRYRILSKLGEGGMGEVFLAEDASLGRRVALKLPAAPLSGDAETLARLRREARAAATLNHPHVCVVHEVGEGPAGRPFIAMEYLEGETLAARIRRGRLPADEWLAVGLEAAAALQAAHSRGVVHRDLKPSNIMLTPHGIKLLDFGLASVTRDARLAPEEALTGAFMGTVPYMSPEQARCEEVDARTDLFSLGVVLYEAATGRRPFQGPTPEATRDAILNSAPPPLTPAAGDLPAGIEHVFARALAKPLAERYASAAGLRADLYRVVRARVQAANPERSPRTASALRTRRLAFAAVAVAAALAAASYMLWGRPRALTRRARTRFSSPTS